MARRETVTIGREEYDALIERNSQLEDMLAAQEADNGAYVPHEVALEIMRGVSPVMAFRKNQGITLRELSERTAIAAGYLSEIERGLKPGSTSALSKIARALGTTIDALLID